MEGNDADSAGPTSKHHNQNGGRVSTGSIHKSQLLSKVEQALSQQAEDCHKVYESKLLACMQDLTPQGIF